MTSAMTIPDLKNPCGLYLKVKRRLERRARNKRYRRLFTEGTPPAGSLGSSTAPSPALYFGPEQRGLMTEEYRRLFPADVELEREYAEKVLSGRFELLGRTYDFGGGPIDWHLDPVSGRDWDRAFFADIAFRGEGRLGDVKYPWELSKQQHLVVLGKRYWLTGDIRLAREFADEVTSWINDNPPYCGVNWISGLEMGQRLLSWIIAYSFFAGSEAVDGDFTERLVASISVQARHVFENLSLDGTPNNHLIGEAASLLVCGEFLGPASGEGLSAAAVEILEREISRQFHPDGVNREQSPNYHRLSLEFYYLAQLLLLKKGRSLSGEALGMMEKATEALMQMLKDTDAGVVERAIDAIGKIGDKRTEEAMIHFASKGNEKMRALAIKALGEMDY